MASDLAVGGPYTAIITSDNYADYSITDIFVSLGETVGFDVTLSPATMDEIIVTSAAVQVAQVALGPSTSFDYDDLQNLPSINRDINDVVRIDPRIYIDRAFVDSVQCVGANPRFNSLTVDGVKKQRTNAVSNTGVTP